VVSVTFLWGFGFGALAGLSLKSPSGCKETGRRWPLIGAVKSA
jgi:hypothetical protein